MKSILQPHLNTQIGINILRAYHVDQAELIAVEEAYFSVTTEKDSNTYHVPYQNIVKVIENAEGVTVGGLFMQHKTFPLVVKIGHVVENVPT